MEENEQKTPAKPPTNKAVAWALGHKPILAFVAVAAVVIVATAIHFQTFTPGTPLPLTKTLEHDGVAIDYPKGWEDDSTLNGVGLIFSEPMEEDPSPQHGFSGRAPITSHPITESFGEQEALEEMSSDLYKGKTTGRIKKFDIDGHEAFSQPIEQTLLDEEGEEEIYGGTKVIVKFDNVCTEITALARIKDGPDAVATANAIAGSVRVVSEPKQATVTFYSDKERVETVHVGYFGPIDIPIPSIEKSGTSPTMWKVIEGGATIQIEDDGSFSLLNVSGNTKCVAQWDKPASPDEQKALDKALSYLSFSAFSRSRLIEQLEYSGFSTAEATYAADNCGADWNGQAAREAASALEKDPGKTERSLMSWLETMKFTESEAEYAIKSMGY